MIENRTEQVMIRLKPSELRYIRREADERKQRLSDYIRAALLANAFLSFPDDKNS